MLNISGFYDCSSTNGEGWRSVIFFSGCPHRCYKCHNPETWDKKSGADYTVEELTQMVLKNKNFIDGVTLSGGEPFQEENIDEILIFVNNLRSHGLNIWCYSGYIYEDLLKNSKYVKLLNMVDVLVDGPFIYDLLDPELKFRGSSNQRIIKLNKNL